MEYRFLFVCCLFIEPAPIPYRKLTKPNFECEYGWYLIPARVFIKHVKFCKTAVTIVLEYFLLFTKDIRSISLHASKILNLQLSEQLKQFFDQLFGPDLTAL